MGRASPTPGLDLLVPWRGVTSETSLQFRLCPLQTPRDIPEPPLAFNVPLSVCWDPQASSCVGQKLVFYFQNRTWSWVEPPCPRVGTAGTAGSWTATSSSLSPWAPSDPYCGVASPFLSIPQVTNVAQRPRELESNSGILTWLVL